MVFTTVPGVLKQINSYKREMWAVNSLTDIYTATLGLNGTAAWKQIPGNYNLCNLGGLLSGIRCFRFLDRSLIAKELKNKYPRQYRKILKNQ